MTTTTNFTAPDYGRSSGQWRARCPGPWHDYTHHPFVEGMKDATLPEIAFMTCLRQDYLSLTHFSGAWALAVVKAGNLDEMQAASAAVHAPLHFEMALHVEICEGEGISRAELEAAEEVPANMADARYVPEAGYSDDFLDLVAAFVPCIMGCGEIGARLLQQVGGTPHRNWIEIHGDEKFQPFCRDTGALIDRAVADRLGSEPETRPGWSRLCRHFTNAMRLEIGFRGLGQA